MEWTSHECSHHQQLSWLNVIDQSVKGSGHRCLRHASFWSFWHDGSLGLQQSLYFGKFGRPWHIVLLAANPPQIVFMARQGFVTNKWSGFWESMATVCSYNTMHCWFRWSKLNSLINKSNHLAPREKIHRFKGIGLGLHLASRITFSMCDMYYYVPNDHGSRDMHVYENPLPSIS